MLKLTRHVFGWTADRALPPTTTSARTTTASSARSIPRDGDKLYYVSAAERLLEALRHADARFLVLHRQLAESFAKLGDSIYFQDDEGLYVNLFIAVGSRRGRRKATPRAGDAFPESRSHDSDRQGDGTWPSRCAFACRTGRARRLRDAQRQAARKLRRARAATSCSIAPGSDGDRVEVDLPMRLHAAPMPDDATVQAVMYGPLVLAGKLGTAGLTAETLRAEPTKPRTVPEYKAEPVAAPTIRAASADPSTWLKPAGGGALSSGPSVSRTSSRWCR